MTDDLVKILNQQLSDLNIEVSQQGEHIDIVFTVASIEIQLVCKFPDAFPYVFPKIFLSDKTHNKIGSIPHINSDSSLCLFDVEKVIPNFTAPIKLIEETIRQAYRVLEDGILGNNEYDFFDEFNAYWIKGSKHIFYSDAVFGADLLHLKFYIGNNECYISNNVDGCIRIALSRGESPKTHDVQDCIYIPLKESCYEETMITQKDFWSIIKSKSEYYKEYSSFISGRTAKKNLILFSQPKGSDFIVNGFLHNKISDAKGFRKGKTPLGVSLAGKAGMEKIEHINLIDVSQKRLFFRGGLGSAMFDKSFGIVGCGSLGSNLAETLMNCGYYRFSFCDNQNLTVENIARHVCGFSDIKSAKTEALKNKFIRHNPNMLIKTYAEDIHSIISNKTDFFYDIDYLILTVANTPIEHRIVEMFCNGEINIPVVIMWVEPFAIAGHALVLNKPQDIYSELFTEEFTFTKNIVLNGEKYYKREAGCQSTFMPYSGLDVKDFSISFAKYFTSEKCDSNKNYHFIWIGNIESAKEHGIELSEKADNFEEYHSYIERID